MDIVQLVQHSDKLINESVKKIISYDNFQYTILQMPVDYPKKYLQNLNLIFFFYIFRYQMHLLCCFPLMGS